MRFGVDPQPWAGRRGRDGDDQLHVGHDGPPQGRADHASQHLAQRHDVRLAPRRQRPRRLPAHAAPVPLQRVGDALRRHRDGRSPHRAAQGRRRRDPAPGRRARRHADVRRAGRRQHGPRRRRRVGRARSRAATGCASSSPAHRRRRAPSSAVETELGWEFVQIYGLTETSPLLTINRSREEFDDLSPDGAGGQAEPRRRAGDRLPHARRRPRASCWPAATSSWRATGSNPTPPRQAIVDGWFHTGDGGIDRRVRVRHDLRPQEGRHHLRRRERVVDRGRGRHLPAPRRHRGGGHRHPRREVGRARDRPRRQGRRQRR